jgi:hypothetical protein
MLLVRGALGVLLFAFWVFCMIDVIRTDSSLCRNLRKMWWILIVVFLSGAGGLVWLVAGRPRRTRASNLPYKGNRGSGFTEYERPGRFAATSNADDEEFLRRCRERAEEQRRRYREEQQRDSDDR